LIIFQLRISDCNSNPRCFSVLGVLDPAPPHHDANEIGRKVENEEISAEATISPAARDLAVRDRGNRQRRQMPNWR
jgi:hypothetical protein